MCASNMSSEALEVAVAGDIRDRPCIITRPVGVGDEVGGVTVHRTKGHPRVVRILLDIGYNPIQDGLLRMATINDDVEIVRMLLDEILSYVNWWTNARVQIHRALEAARLLDRRSIEILLQNAL